jgi:hypothetical protein
MLGYSHLKDLGLVVICSLSLSLSLIEESFSLGNMGKKL